MGVTKKKPVFETSDGREFNSEKDAQKHEELIAARRVYDDARQQFGVLLAQTQRTADGHPFRFEMFDDYWYVSPGWWGMPEMKRVPYLGWHWQFSEQDEFVIIHRPDGNGKWEDYKIADLYYRKENAERALVEAQEKWLADRTADLAELRARVCPSES